MGYWMVEGLCWWSVLVLLVAGDGGDADDVECMRPATPFIELAEPSGSPRLAPIVFNYITSLLP